MVTSTSFQLPRDGVIYTESIFSRCRDLIGYEVWSGIEPHRLDMWIRNFRTAEEQYLAARVLDSLIYRSNRQTIALMKQLFQRVIPDLARRQSLDVSLNSVYRSLQDDRADPGVRVVPVIPPGESPTKSGPSIARMLRRNLRFKDDWIIHPEDVSNELEKVKGVVFVDDFLGTGTQFSDFLSDTGLEAELPGACFIYAPLAGHKSGIDFLSDGFPELHVGTVDLLDDSHALFHAQAGSFPDEVNSAETARDLYYELLEDHEIDLDGPDRRGFGHFELAYAFEHAVPDNSLPILWWYDSDDWHPLFDR